MIRDHHSNYVHHDIAHLKFFKMCEAMFHLQSKGPPSTDKEKGLTQVWRAIYKGWNSGLLMIFPFLTILRKHSFYSLSIPIRVLQSPLCKLTKNHDVKSLLHKWAKGPPLFENIQKDKWRRGPPQEYYGKSTVYKRQKGFRILKGKRLLCFSFE